MVSIKPPIKVAMGTAIMVETNPLIAAPIPAICPNGCMAKDLTLPKRNPTEKNWTAKKQIRIKISGFKLS